MVTDSSKDSGTVPRLRHVVLKAGAWVVSGFILDKGLALAQVMALARLLTPADFGLMAMSAAVLLVVFTLSELGIDSAIIARREMHDDDLAVAWTLSGIRAAVLAGGLWLSADVIAQAMRTPELAVFLKVHALSCFLQGAQSPAMALLLRRLDLKQRVRMDLMRRVVEMTVTIGLALWLQSVWALIGGQLVGFAFGCIVSYVVAPFRPRFVLSGPSLQYFLHFGKWVNVTTILTVMVMSGGEFLVGRMLGADTLGLYQIALAIPLLIGVRAPVMIGQVSLPTYAMLQTDRSGVIKAFFFQMKIVGLLLLPASISLAVFAPVLVPFLFGPQWMDAVEPLRILSLYAICAGLTGTMTAVQYGMNRSDLPMRIALTQSVVYAIVITPMIIEFGLAGAAGALVLAYSIGVLLSVRYTVQLIGGEIRPVLVSLMWIFVISGGVGGGIMQVLPKTPMTGARFLLMGCVVAMLYGIYLWRIEYPKLLSLWKGEAW